MQTSLASFLFQHGSTDRTVLRHYLDGLFRREGSQRKAFGTDAIRNPLPTTP